MAKQVKINGHVKNTITFPFKGKMTTKKVADCTSADIEAFKKTENKNFKVEATGFGKSKE